jgi:hypothetical protein
VGMGKLRNPDLSGSISLSFSWLSQTERRRRVLRGQGVGKCGPSVGQVWASVGQVWASVGQCGKVWEKSVHRLDGVQDADKGYLAYALP